MSSSDIAQPLAVDLTVTGNDLGLQFKARCAQLADECRLAGFVESVDGNRVVIHLEGLQYQISAFRERLRTIGSGTYGITRIDTNLSKVRVGGENAGGAAGSIADGGSDFTIR